MKMNPAPKLRLPCQILVNDDLFIRDLHDVEHIVDVCNIGGMYRV